MPVQIGSPYQITPNPAPVATGTVGRWEFIPSAKPVYISNGSGAVICCKLNVAAGTAVTVADNHFVVPTGTTFVIDDNIAVKSVMIYVPSGTAGNVLVSGWKIGNP